jgi:hypothetical protein
MEQIIWELRKWAEEAKSTKKTYRKNNNNNNNNNKRKDSAVTVDCKTYTDWDGRQEEKESRCKTAFLKQKQNIQQFS